MGDQKTVGEIDVDYSNSQIYWRVEKLVESGVMDPPERGERNQYLFSPEDVKVLRRLAELEDDYDTVREAIEALGEDGIEAESEGERISRERIEEMEKRIAELEEEVEVLEQELAVHEDRIQKFRNRWSEQLKGGVDKIKELFG